jgi:hypothetical protein
MQTGAKTWAFLIASSMLSACGGGGGGTVGPTPPLVTTTFTSWRDPVAGKAIKIDGRGEEVSYGFDLGSQLITSIEHPPREVSASAVFTFSDAGNLNGLFLTSGSTPVAAFDQISVMAADQDFVTAASTTSTAIMSNPKSTAWDYQSFGVWETGLDTNSGSHGVMSLGNSAGTVIPPSGTTNSNFIGKVIGSYVSATGQGRTTVLADLVVNVDWSTQSLTLSTLNTRTSTNGSLFTTSTPVDLTISGTLNYAPNINGFSGTLTTASGLSGNSTGQFYGPNAEELGGVFILQDPINSTSPETYSGAYGAKR